ncbi:uncharacterized protein LOC110685014 [Chenopodium quinoa]|uniref:uncharacterized protein LOC110685014 n=1 Tax=Chenopodium quinoa TaxID=63459 RepID=UPI000B782113|nr:uncharacterized protein LOC110685014 [Chenopodium quinoa]
MVTSSSNRSPSPISMRSNPNPNPNPNSRNDQEQREGVGVRKSFSGYPFAKSSIATQPRSFTPNTPVNSPAEYARRSSFGRECGAGIGDHEQKENERDPNLKPIARVRSPSVLKGTKNFMSPTISAASKINPSPRKKVLGERNEASRTSASLSDGKFHFFSTNSLDFTGENESKTDMGTPPFSMISDFNKVGNEVSNTELENKVAYLSPGVGKIESESDLVVLSPEIPLKSTTKSPEILPQSEMPKVVANSNVGLDIKNNISSSPSVIAPLDADPFHSPYDPKTNFLSPRPQFLHYKPNQGVRLEDDFGSDSVSEAENCDEVQSETSQEVQEETSSSAEPLSSESSSPKSEELVEELDEIVESKIEPRTRFSGKWKTVTFLFFILLGSISFSMYYPGDGNAINQGQIISQIYSSSRVAADLAKDNFNVLFLNAKVLSAQSVGYLSQMISKEREIKFSPLPFNNLTGWQEEEVENDYLVKGFEFRPWLGKEVGVSAMKKAAETVIFEDETELIKLDNCEADVLEQSSGLPIIDQVIIEEYEPENTEESSVLEEPVFEDDAIVEMSEEASLSDDPEKLEKTSVLEHKDSAVEMTEGLSVLDDPENQEAEHDLVTSAVQDESQSDLKVEYQPSSSSPGPEVHSQVPTANVPFSDVELLSDESEEVKVQSASRSLVVEGADLISQILEASERSLAPITAAVSLVVLSLLAATAFKLVKKSKKETPAVSTPLADAHVVQKENSSFVPKARKIDPKVRENPSSCSGPVEVDMIGESCPSELSSFQKTSSYYKKTDPRGSDEAQSVEKSSRRNHKRESLASSSSEYTMDSSYGSFTTYGIVHSKQLDDEVVTPIRRSSRIRSKVTSP